MQEAGPRLDALPARLGGHYERRQMGNRKHGPAVWSRHVFEDLETVALPRATRIDLPVQVFRSVAERVALVVRVRNVCVANVHLDHGQVANRRQLRHLVATRMEIDVIAGDFNVFGRTRVAGFEDIGPRRATHFAKGIVPVRIDRCLARNMVATRAGRNIWRRGRAAWNLHASAPGFDREVANEAGAEERRPDWINVHGSIHCCAVAAGCSSLKLFLQQQDFEQSGHKLNQEWASSTVGHDQ